MTGSKGSVRHSSSGPEGTTSVWPAKQNTGPPLPRLAQKLSTGPKRKLSTVNPDGLEPLDHQRLAAAVGGTDRLARDQLLRQLQGIGHQKRSTGGWRRRLTHKPKAAQRQRR